MARAFTLVWSGQGIRTFTATGNRPVQEHEPTLFEIWVCVDGYWTDLTKNLCPGELSREYDRLARSAAERLSRKLLLSRRMAPASRISIDLFGLASLRAAIRVSPRIRYATV